MRILQVVDCADWAIGKLAKVIQEENPQIDIRILVIHPKDLRYHIDVYSSIFTNEVKRFKPDVIHFHYWDTANTLSQLEDVKDIKKILTHHNQKNLLSHEWKNIDEIIVHTQRAKNILNDAGYNNVTIIQHGIDIENFRYNDNYDVNNNTLGYVGRIVPWKGLYEILKVAKTLEQKVIMMGRIDKGNYWKQCLEFNEQMDERFNTPDEDQVSVYHEMGIYVGNSRAGLEEGPLGLLEAMACGIPVVTTPSGEGADIIKDAENGFIADFENETSLQVAIEKCMSADKDKIRKNAWDTVRHMSTEVMARKYLKLYYKTAYEKPLVSVIIPTYNRHDTITNVIDHYSRQSHQPIEIIVIDDNSNDETKDVIFEWATKHKDVDLKYFNTYSQGYNLAKARNMGIFDATGEYLVFSDDRFIPNEDAVECFYNALEKMKIPSAVWGDKCAGKRDFIENFFMIRKSHIAIAGMFNERINEYGGMSQEIRARLQKQGFMLKYIPEAKAKPQFGTRNRSIKRYELFRMKTKLWLLDN